MFFNLLFIHLFRPFLKYSATNTPLPSHVSPRKMCTQAAARISKLLRLYNRTYGLRQVCNIVVYIAHAASTIHLLNLPDRDAARDLGHGVRQLDDVAQAWPCARRTLATLARQGRKWNIALPEDVALALARAEAKYADAAAASPPPHHGAVSDPPPKDERRRNGPDTVSPTLQQAQRLVRPPHAHAPPPAAAVAGGGGGHGLVLSPSMPSLVDDTGSSIATDPAPPLDAPAPPMPPLVPTTNPAAQLQPQRSRPPPPAGAWAFATGGPGDTDMAMGANPAANMGAMGVESIPPLPPQQQQQQQNAHGALFSSLDSLFEEGRDWWFRDQSQVYDAWGAVAAAEGRRDSASTLDGSSGSGGGAAGNGMDMGKAGFMDFGPGPGPGPGPGTGTMAGAAPGFGFGDDVRLY